MTWLHVQDFELDAAFQLGLLRGDRIRDLTERWERCVLQQFARVSSISNAMVKHTHDKGEDDSVPKLGRHRRNHIAVGRGALEKPFSIGAGDKTRPTGFALLGIDEQKTRT